MRARLDEDQARSVLKLAADAAGSDGVAPLSEHVVLHLRYGGDPRARNVLLFESGELAGYAHLDPTDPVEGPSAELVIHPRLRRRGLGRMALSALVTQAGGRPLRLWAHGDLPAAGGLAASAGFERARSLWQMRRSLAEPLGEPEFADGITIRTFAVGQDEAAWTELNRRAFARHPEQGAWTREDLDRREHETWFDPGGFFLAERGGRLVGFHWTKIHGGKTGSGDHEREIPRGGHGHEAIGEVYVVGVDPTERGTGLGRALTLVGLRYLRSRGLAQVMLYVDESNTPAIRLYESLGFTHRGTDVMFRHEGSRTPFPADAQTRDAHPPESHAPNSRATP
ncbi:MAG: mycothiol synthase [Micromonosporaceae bacterium]